MRSIFLRLAAGTEFGPRKGAAVLLLILLLVGVRSVLRAISKPFWFDELCTVIVSRLPGAAAIWKALDQAADGQPLSVHLSLPVAGKAFEPGRL